MQEEDWQTITLYVTRLQRALLLDAWDIRIEREPPDPNDGLDGLDIDAQATIQRDARLAKIRFAENLRDQDDDAIRHVVTHELLHLPTDWPFSDGLDMIEALAGEQAYGTAKIALTRSYERMVDALTQAIAPLMPRFTWNALGSIDATDEPAT